MNTLHLLLPATLLLTSLSLQAGQAPPPPPPPLELVDAKRKIMSIDTVTQARQDALPIFERLVHEGHYVQGCGGQAYPYEQQNGNFTFPIIDNEQVSALIDELQAFERHPKETLMKGIEGKEWEALPLVLSRLDAPGFPDGLANSSEDELRWAERRLRPLRESRKIFMRVAAKAQSSHAMPALLGCLVDPDKAVRVEAFDILSQMNLSSLKVPLLVLAAHEDSSELMDMLELACGVGRTQQQAIKKLGQSDPSSIVKGLQAADMPLSVLFSRLEALVSRLQTGHVVFDDKLKGAIKGLSCIRPGDDQTTLGKACQILMAHFHLMMGAEQDMKFLGKMADSSEWCIRFLATRALGSCTDAWREATPILLTRQRDHMVLIRAEANKSLVHIHSLPLVMGTNPAPKDDAVVVTQWEQWWMQRSIEQDQEKGWTVVPMKEDESMVFSEAGPVRHRMLTGTMGRSTIHLIDHNDNGSCFDFGIDNVAVGDPLKPGCFVSRLVLIEGVWHDYRRGKGNAIELRKYSGDFGKVDIQGNYATGLELGLVSLMSAPDTIVMLENPKSREFSLDVPVGNYSLYTGHVREGSRIKPNQTRFHFSMGRKMEVKIAKNHPATLKLGGDFQCTVRSALDTNKGSTQLVLSGPKLLGAGGEYFSGSPQAMDRLEVWVCDGHGKKIKSFPWRPQPAAKLDLMGSGLSEDAMIAALQFHLKISKIRYDFWKPRVAWQHELFGILSTMKNPDGTLRYTPEEIEEGRQVVARYQAIFDEAKTGIEDATARLEAMKSGDHAKISVEVDATASHEILLPLAIPLKVIPEGGRVEIRGHCSLGNMEPYVVEFRRPDKRN